MTGRFQFSLKDLLWWMRTILLLAGAVDTVRVLRVALGTLAFGAQSAVGIGTVLPLAACDQFFSGRRKG